MLTEAVEVVAENGRPGSGKESLVPEVAYGVVELCWVGTAADGRPGNTAGLGVDGALTADPGLLEDICALFITLGLGVDGLGDVMDDEVCPENAD